MENQQNKKELPPEKPEPNKEKESRPSQEEQRVIWVVLALFFIIIMWVISYFVYR
jgi:cell division septal protein FtsQ